ncbi:phage neck terminator protein [Symbiopectobacterium sp.]|uniref:phage neck terminator protein n=1 Tax=Symbiopectobacterium sp. TaxID=2952789 RepID=UPI003F2C52A1
MESIDDLYGVFQQLVSLTSGVETVILADQGRDAPTGLYATYKPIPIRAYGWSQRRRELTTATAEADPDLEQWQDLRETVATSMEFILSVNILNEGADTAIMRLHNANFRQPVSEFLYRNEIAWRNVSTCRNLTGILQAGIQPRWQADIHLFIEQTISYELLRAAGFDVQFTNEG